MRSLRLGAEDEDHVDQQGGGRLEEMRWNRDGVEPLSGTEIARSLRCRLGPGLHPSGQTPANQENISICMVNRTEFRHDLPSHLLVSSFPGLIDQDGKPVLRSVWDHGTFFRLRSKARSMLRGWTTRSKCSRTSSESAGARSNGSRNWCWSRNSTMGSESLWGRRGPGR